jgi:hypothetical protein
VRREDGHGCNAAVTHVYTVRACTYVHTRKIRITTTTYYTIKGTTHHHRTHGLIDEGIF